MRHFGTVIRGVRMPVIQQGMDIVDVVTKELFQAFFEENVIVRDGDIIGITESVVARSQGNYATSEQLSLDVRNKTGGGTLGLVHPIFSRNRFLGILKAIAGSCSKLVVMLGYPTDEVGNALLDIDTLEAQGVNPYEDTFSEAEFRKRFGDKLLHPFTGVDYPKLYKEASPNIEIIFSNKVTDILKYTDTAIVADIHTRNHSKSLLKKAGAKIVLGLDDLLTSSVSGSGYNADYGVLGSNFAGDGWLKLFPRDGQVIVETIQKNFFEKYQKHVEVLIYGDGAFKDPVGKIWELADPVVAPFYTSGLKGVPHEIKFKLVSDTKYGHLSSEEASKEIRKYIKDNQPRDINSHEALGTTPRQLTDLIGSLCDLSSGSGDKGTPVIYIQGYFDKYFHE